VVTGTGLVTAAGAGMAAFESCIDAGESRLKPFADGRGGGGGAPSSWGWNRLGPEWIGGQVDDGLLASWERLETADDRAVPLAGLALDEALAGAGLGCAAADRPPRAPLRLGLALGTALGPSAALERQVHGGAGTANSPGLAGITLEAYAARLHRAACDPARGLGPGPRSVFSVTCVSGLCALEQAAADLAFRRADAVLVGGADTVSASMHAGFRALQALSPSGRLRPFDAEHDGILIAEAACSTVIEPGRAAALRGVRPRAAVLAQRLVSDAVHLTSPDLEGKGMARAIAGALGDAGLDPRDLGGITLTATGSAVYDRMQSAAVRSALGEQAVAEIPATTWEPAVGHVLAATGVLGIAHAARVIERGRVPAVPCSPAGGGSSHPHGVGRIDPECRLGYVIGRPVALRAPCVLALTVGFGGQNGATIIGSLELAADLAGRSLPA
jgi:3-oxoacyl-[acyl-carrier-protein] synthase II